MDLKLDRRELRSRVLDIVPEWADRSRTLIMGIRGSHAHGTYIPPEDPSGIDDIDVFAVTAQDPAFYFGLRSYNTQGKYGRHFEKTSADIDVVVYDVRKFGYLLIKGNPNVHTWLWSPQDCYLYRSPAGRQLFEARELFLSNHVLNSTAGYARQQLHRMHHFERQGYMGRKRKELISQYGYDLKNAAHCVRLLATGTHLAETGEFIVRHTGSVAALIKTIKQGRWTLPRVKEVAEDMFTEFEAAAAKADLPRRPDLLACSKVVEQVICTHIEYRSLTYGD